MNDDTLRLSNSTLRNFKRCARSWYLSYNLGYGLRPESDNPVTVATLGTRVHCALEAYYGYNLDPLAALRVIYYLAEKERPLNVDELQKQHSYAKAMVEGFIQWSEEEGIDAALEVIQTEHVEEQPLALDDGTVVRLMAKLDQKVRRLTDGAILFRDWKPQPLTEPVLTPTGWVEIGDLKPGDMVCDSHGKPVKVVNVYDRGIDDVYKVTFNDGTWIRGTADHPWMASRYKDQQAKIIQTSDLRKGWRVARFTPAQDDVDVELPIDPYVLGAWIANGDRRGRGISDGVSEPLEATGLIITVSQREGRQPLYEAKLTKEIRGHLADLKLLMTYSVDRFIPAVYLYEASYSQRLKLLHGLMDGDGCFNPRYRSSASYSTVSTQLAEDVASLVRGLGGWSKVWTSKVPTYTGTIEKSVIVRTSFNPFKHIEHAREWPIKRTEVAAKAGGGRGKHGLLTEDKIIWSVKADGQEAVRCIELDSEDHLYTTRGYAISHNTVGTLSKAHLLVLDEQMRMYSLLEALSASETDERADGGLYTMLLRSKRTPKANGPFYREIEVSFNQHDLDSMTRRTKLTATRIVEATRKLNDGASHLDVIEPNPGDYCGWGCPFTLICPMMDDGSRWEDALQANFIKRDPFGYYGTGLIDQVRASLTPGSVGD